MFKHTFIFSPGTWYGEGKILLNLVEEELLFQTHWVVQPRDFTGKIECSQQVQIQGLAEEMRNGLTFYDVQTRLFTVEMENQNVGRVIGSGVFDETMIAWEFRSTEVQFEGFETYFLQNDLRTYLMKAEYITSDQLRTQIEAVIKLQSQEVSEMEEPRESEE